MQGSYLGPMFEQSDIEIRLKNAGGRFSILSDQDLISSTVAALVDEKAVGWFQGRMEFGPRALGARSILGDPRSATMQKSLNLRVKFRESFRPFAPAILREDVADWFELNEDSPYMLLVADIVERRRRAMTIEEQGLFGIDKLNVRRSDIPAVTHVDYSARVQTVQRYKPALPCAACGLQTANRLPGSRQYQFQYPGRADRVHAGRCVPMLHGQAIEGVGHWQLACCGRKIRTRGCSRDYQETFELD